MSDKKAVGVVVGSTLVLMAVHAAIGALLWPYSIETVAAILGNSDASVAWWQGALIGFVPYIGYTTIPAAVIVWILSLILL